MSRFRQASDATPYARDGEGRLRRTDTGEAGFDSVEKLFEPKGSPEPLDPEGRMPFDSLDHSTLDLGETPGLKERFGDDSREARNVLLSRAAYYDSGSEAWRRADGSLWTDANRQVSRNPNLNPSDPPADRAET